ncbi:TPA: hypothetical protein ACRGCJ_005501, partial [Klebsiella pneumoniae]
ALIVTEYIRAITSYYIKKFVLVKILADFYKSLFLSISCSLSMPLQDAGQLLPATRPKPDLFNLTEGCAT